MTTIGGVVSRVWCIVVQSIHHQPMLVVSEAHSVRPTSGRHSDVLGPAYPTITTPAHHPGRAIVYKTGDDHLVVGERVHSIPVVGEAQVHDAGPARAAISSLPNLTKFGTDITYL